MPVLGETKQWVLLFPLTTVVHSSLVGEFGDFTGVWYDPVCWVPGSSWVFRVGEFPLAVAPSLLGSVGESLFPSLLGSVGGSQPGRGNYRSIVIYIYIYIYI